MDRKVGRLLRKALEGAVLGLPHERLDPLAKLVVVLAVRDVLSRGDAVLECLADHGHCDVDGDIADRAKVREQGAVRVLDERRELGERLNAGEDEAVRQRLRAAYDGREAEAAGRGILSSAQSHKKAQQRYLGAGAHG